MNDAPGAALGLPPWRVERILFDEGGVLVVDKPVGLPVYGGDLEASESVTDRLKGYLRERGRDDYLAVHQRLDQETSGVLFFVTDPKQNAQFSAAMESHELSRVYHAVVELRGGEGASRLAQEKTVEVWLQHERGRSQVTSGRPGRGDSRRAQAKRAVTHYRVLRRAGDRALLELRLETGRTHQIRATLSHLGFPIVGDRLYDGAAASRLMLHAHEISGGPLPRAVRAQVPECFEGALLGAEEFPADPQAALLDAATLRAPLLSQTDALRLVNGAGDGLFGLTVDAYGPYAVLSVYDDALLSRARELAKMVFDLGFAGVYVKKRVRADLRTQDAAELSPKGALLGSDAPDGYVVNEMGLRLRVHLDDGLSTGLFLDMRDNRKRVATWARGGRMLNLFCYTSSFSVAAALAGAKTTSVDVSAKALERSRANFEENGIALGEHRFFKDDAMKFLAREVRRQSEYDFIVLDPPSFATVGKGTFSVKNEYGQAAADCFRIIAPSGRLLCVTNHTKTTPRALRLTVEAACRAAGRELLQLKELKPGPDFPPHPEGPWPSKSLLAEVR